MKQSPKPPPTRVSDWGATVSTIGKRRLLTRSQFAEMHRKLADVNAKLCQLCSRPSAGDGVESALALSETGQLRRPDRHAHIPSSQ
jgi:hypothetical protein